MLNVYAFVFKKVFIGSKNKIKLISPSALVQNSLKFTGQCRIRSETFKLKAADPRNFESKMKSLLLVG